jgi:multisubunit Na+/H+ antiporter MnhB subunit
MASKSSVSTIRIVFEIIGALLGIAFFVLLFSSISTITPFTYGQPLLTVELGNIPESVTQNLWSNRGIDMILQAFVLFATAVGAAALFREEIKRRNEE